MDEREYMEKLDERISVLERDMHENIISQLKQVNELEKLITKAVQNGNEPIMKAIKDHENRLIILEHSDATKALERTKRIGHTVITVAITFFITLLLNNMIATITNANIKANQKQEEKQVEVQNGK